MNRNYKSLSQARKNLDSKTIRNLLNQAQTVAKEFRQKETELIAILQKLDNTKPYRATGFNSLYQFCVEFLELTEHQSYQYITVARKCTEVPELMVALEDRRITVSKARKLSSVINTGNQKDWIDLASSQSQKDVEKAVRAKQPLPPVKDHMQILSETQVKLQATLDLETAGILERVMKLMSEKRRGGQLNVNQALKSLCGDYLHKHDPVEKAKRALSRNQKVEDIQHSQNQLGENRVENSVAFTPRKDVSGRRRPLPSQTKHQVILRDQGQCRFHRKGKRCQSRRYLEIHHKKPLSKGGADSLENLVLVCSEHHKVIHAQF